MAKISYNEKMKRLRPFVNFNYDLRKNLDTELSAVEKNKITRHYNELSKLYSQATTIYRPKSRRNIKVAKEASGMKGAGFKAFAIPSPTGAGRVKVTKSGIVIKTKGAETRTIALDMRRLVLGPREYLSPLLKAKTVYIINSKYDWGGSGEKEFIIRRMEEIIAKYAWDMPDDDDDDDGENKERFPIYLIEVNLTNQKSVDEYILARAEAQKQNGKKKRKATKKGR